MANEITQSRAFPKLFILVIGPTGSGKSKFINTLLKGSPTQVGSALKSCTQKIKSVAVPPDICGSEYMVFLVDTPGFDCSETDTSDYKTWREITDCVKEWQGNKHHVAAIYLANAMDKGSCTMINRNMRSFKELYGPKASRAIVFGATRLNWEENATIRNQCFKSFVGICAGQVTQLEEKKQIARYNDTHESALALVHMVIKLVQRNDGVGIRVENTTVADLALQKIAIAAETRSRIERTRVDPNIKRIQKGFWERNCVIC